MEVQRGLFPTCSLDGATRDVEGETDRDCASGCRAGKEVSILGQIIGRGWMVPPLIVTHLKGGDNQDASSFSCQM